MVIVAWSSTVNSPLVVWRLANAFKRSNAKYDSSTSRQKRFSVLPENVKSHRTTMIKWGLAGYLIRIARASASRKIIPNVNLSGFNVYHGFRLTAYDRHI